VSLLRQGLGRRALVPLVPVVLLAALALSGCGSTGAAGEGVVTAVNTPTAPATFTQEQLDAIVTPRKAAFESAVKAFRKCDRKVSSDSYTASPCLAKAAAETAVVDDALTDLGSVQVPTTYAATIASMKRLSTAGAAVATKCKKANDQKCDQALARFRADEQSLLWDLDIQL
jgi:hypothetical protein